jgi:hypothetical protein
MSQPECWQRHTQISPNSSTIEKTNHMYIVLNHDCICLSNWSTGGQNRCPARTCGSPSVTERHPLHPVTISSYIRGLTCTATTTGISVCSSYWRPASVPLLVSPTSVIYPGEGVNLASRSHFISIVRVYTIHTDDCCTQDTSCFPA